MCIVLCASNDMPALWAYEGLKKMGVRSLELVTTETLAYSRHWEHRLGAEGLSVRIGLADGRWICSEAVRGVMNRLLSVPLELINMAVPADREYASQETMAFYMSWLHALPGPVLNRPTPQGFSGRWRHASEWSLLAAESGLPTRTYRQTGFDPLELGYTTLAPPSQPVKTVITLAGKTFGAKAPEEISAGCLRLSEHCGTELLGIDFYNGTGPSWTFASATPMPDLRLGGGPLLETLAHVFRSTGGEQ